MYVHAVGGGASGQVQVAHCIKPLGRAGWLMLSPSPPWLPPQVSVRNRKGPFLSSQLVLEKPRKIHM